MWASIFDTRSHANSALRASLDVRLGNSRKRSGQWSLAMVVFLLLFLETVESHSSTPTVNTRFGIIRTVRDNVLLRARSDDKLRRCTVHTSLTFRVLFTSWTDDPTNTAGTPPLVRRNDACSRNRARTTRRLGPRHVWRRNARERVTNRTPNDRAPVRGQVARVNRVFSPDRVPDGSRDVHVETRSTDRPTDRPSTVSPTLEAEARVWCPTCENRDAASN